MAHLIEVAFRGNRKEFFSWTGETAPPLKAGVIVEADRGEDFGRVHSTGELAEVRCNGCAHGCGTTPPPRAALRLATTADEQLDRALTVEHEEVRRKSIERVKANHLVMKLTDVEWQWDRRKLTIYFTAERRVDFRGLVRDLAALRDGLAACRAAARLIETRFAGAADAPKEITAAAGALLAVDPTLEDALARALADELAVAFAAPSPQRLGAVLQRLAPGEVAARLGALTGLGNVLPAVSGAGGIAQ